MMAFIQGMRIRTRSMLFFVLFGAAGMGLCGADGGGEGAACLSRESRNPKAEEGEDSLFDSVSAMVRRGHVYLARSQNADGSFSLDREGAGYQSSAPIAVTSLAVLSFMAGGNTPHSGPFRESLKRGIAYLVEACDPETGIFHDDLDQTSKMHGQGFAILALAQASGMYGLEGGAVRKDRRNLEQALRNAVDLVSRIQTEVGGWDYSPAPSSDHEGSITICVVQALRAARNAGVHVEKRVIDKALNYVHRSQKTDGSFRYRLNDDLSTFALTAAGISTLNATGEYDSDCIELGLDYMLKKDPLLNLVAVERYPQYARFYAAQAYFQYHDHTVWERWYPLLVKQCLELQFPDGSWPNESYGSVYATAMITLTLQVPFGFLPIFQR